MKSSLFTWREPVWKCHVRRNSKPSNNFAGRKESFFIFVVVFNPKHDSLSALAFLALHPSVCVYDYQPMCGSRSLGAAAFPCLMALKGLCRARKIPRICSYHPVFKRCLSALLVWSSSGTWGWPCCLAVGQDAARLGGTALVGKLSAFHLLCWALPTSKGSQKKRISTPQHKHK